MANTVYGPFAAINVVNGSTPANATWGNNVQTQASVALNGLNGDFWSSHVLSGVTPSIDGTLANQLDIASGTVYLRMNDNSLARCVVAATNFTTSTPSTTYYLDLNPDGSWSWGTTHSVVANHFPVAQCTTDGSGNIATLTDNRGPSGQPGVPLITRVVQSRLVTATTVQHLGGPTPIYNGLYRATVYFWYSNATPQKPTFTVFWTDPTGNLGASAHFMAISSGCAGQILDGSQANTPGNNQAIACLPITFKAKGGVQILFDFTDPGGTPNDTVEAITERLA